MWVNHPLQVSQLGQLSLSSFLGNEYGKTLPFLLLREGKGGRAGGKGKGEWKWRGSGKWLYPGPLLKGGRGDGKGRRGRGQGARPPVHIPGYATGTVRRRVSSDSN